MINYCMQCGSPASAGANFCQKCGRPMKAGIKSVVAKKQTPDEEEIEGLTDIHKAYIKENYKKISVINLAKKLFPKEEITHTHPSVKQISEYTRLLKRADVGGGDMVVGAEEEDEDGGGESLDYMPEIKIDGLEVETCEADRVQKVSFGALLEEAKRNGVIPKPD